MGIYLRTEALQEGVKKREIVLKHKDMVSFDLIVNLYSVLLTIFQVMQSFSIATFCTAVGQT